MEFVCLNEESVYNILGQYPALFNKSQSVAVENQASAISLPASKVSLLFPMEMKLSFFFFFLPGQVFEMKFARL